MVKLKPFEVRWSKRSLDQLHEIHEYIKQDSRQGADKVVKSIAKRVDSLSTHAMIYEADRFKRNNDGSYRATSIYKFRIIYRITENQVAVLKILHTARLPRKY
jgi:plasmid stabilization system protein ParE